MLVTDIIRRVRESTGDIAVLQFTNSNITDWINDAIREIVIDNSLLQARASASTVVNQSDYNLPPDIFKIHSVLVNGRKMQAQTLEEWEAAYATAEGEVPKGFPKSFYIYAGVMTLSPTPTEIHSLVINYTKMPTSIAYSPGPSPSDDTWTPATPAIPEAYHNRIVTYCLAQVAFQDEDINKYQMLMQEFHTGVRDLSRIKDQQEDLYPFISVSDRDMGDYYG